MTTANLVTVIQAAVTDLNTAHTDLAGFIALQEPAVSTADPRVDSGNAVQVAEAQHALRAVDACLQLLNQRRFQSGSKLDATFTVA